MFIQSVWYHPRQSSHWRQFCPHFAGFWQTRQGYFTGRGPGLTSVSPASRINKTKPKAEFLWVLNLGLVGWSFKELKVTAVPIFVTLFRIDNVSDGWVKCRPSSSNQYTKMLGGCASCPPFVQAALAKYVWLIDKQKLATESQNCHSECYLERFHA